MKLLNKLLTDYGTERYYSKANNKCLSIEKGINGEFISICISIYTGELISLNKKYLKDLIDDLSEIYESIKEN